MYHDYSKKQKPASSSLSIASIEVHSHQHIALIEIYENSVE